MIILRTPSMLLTPAFRCTWLLGVILLLAATTGWAQADNASTGALQDLKTSRSLPEPSGDHLAKLESIYKDIHANPELSMQEQRTARIAADWLRQQGYEVTEKIGDTGAVGLLRNGEGATVLLRADMDALPMKENTGLAYASTKTGKDPSGVETAIAHSCGHDMHVAWLMGVTQIVAQNRDKWRGTVMAVFQPAEETGEGAKAMVEDGMVKRFPKPDIAFAQHVMSLPAGRIAIRSGQWWVLTLKGTTHRSFAPRRAERERKLEPSRAGRHDGEQDGGNARDRSACQLRKDRV